MRGWLNRGRDMAESEPAEAPTGPAAVTRPPFVFWVCLWAVGIQFALAAALYDVRHPAFNTPLFRDFSNFYTAGKLVLEGQAWRAFDPGIFIIELREHVGALTMQNYSYPPHAMFLAAPFAALPYVPAFIAFTIAGIAAFALAARPYVRGQFHPLLAALTPAAGFCVWNGHYGLLLGAL